LWLLNPFIRPKQNSSFGLEVQKIRYHTKLVNYTIALWQDAMAGGSATLGPAIVRKSPPNPLSIPVHTEPLHSNVLSKTRVTNGPQKEFDWQVQLYSFDLSVSNVFFFWLKEGGLDTLGSTTSADHVFGLLQHHR
jgi:hypothetical protein